MKGDTEVEDCRLALSRALCVSLSLSVRLVRKEESRIKSSLSVSQHRGKTCRREAVSCHPLGKPCYSSNVGNMCLESMHKEEASDSDMGVCGRCVVVCTYVCTSECTCVYVCTCTSVYVCVYLCTCMSVPVCVSLHPSLSLCWNAHGRDIVTLLHNCFPCYRVEVCT